jgi:hypothetical protein
MGKGEWCEKDKLVLDEGIKMGRRSSLARPVRRRFWGKGIIAKMLRGGEMQLGAA